MCTMNVLYAMIINKLFSVLSLLTVLMTFHSYLNNSIIPISLFVIRRSDRRRHGQPEQQPGQQPQDRPGAAAEANDLRERSQQSAGCKRSVHEL